MQVIRLWKEVRNVVEDINLGQITTQAARIRCEEMKSVEGIHSGEKGMNPKQAGGMLKNAQQRATIWNTLEKVLSRFLQFSLYCPKPRDIFRSISKWKEVAKLHSN